MKYAIIAAGEGSRLAQEGITVPKPLVRVGGHTLLERLLYVFMQNGSQFTGVVCNHEEVISLLEFIMHDGLTMGDPAQTDFDAHVSYMVRHTPSSMHSLHELSVWLRDEPFVLTTVDTIFRADEFRRYVAEFQRLLATGEADGLMGVTSYIDDEKPLYVRADAATGLITHFLDADPQPQYASAGIYGLTPRALDTLDGCMARGESRMRNYQRALLRDGLRLKAFSFSKVLDVDHASDIAKAEAFLESNHAAL